MDLFQDPDLEGLPEELPERPAVQQLDVEHPQPPGARDLLPPLRRGPGEAQSARVQRGVRTQVLPGGLPACQLSGLEYTIIITKHLGSYSVNQIFYTPSITVKCQL